MVSNICDCLLETVINKLLSGLQEHTELLLVLNKSNELLHWNGMTQLTQTSKAFKLGIHLKYQFIYLTDNWRLAIHIYTSYVAERMEV